MRKRYIATFLLGHTSETDDVEREVFAIPNAVAPTRAMIDAVLPQFIGDIQQRPPSHSAIKIAGRRAYKLARKGAAFELAARTVTVHRLVVCQYEYPELDLEIECGSGTYVRALGRDIATALGTAAVMSSLVRTAIGPFRVEDAAALDELCPQNIAEYIQPALVAAAELPLITLTEAQLTEIRHGRAAAIPASGSNSQEWAAVNATGQLVAILFQKQVGQLWPAHNFGM
jgi:tRNA pseudouridine55 synthase